MQKKELSDEELIRVVSLRKEKKNWTQIQKETGIDRRIVKRDYELWSEKEAAGKIESARPTVAGEAFSRHVTSLINVSRLLTNSLRIPTLRDLNLTVDEFIEQGWDTASTAVFGNAPLYGPDPDDNLRDNRLLFNALKTHTGEKVNWAILHDWKYQWTVLKNTLIEFQNKSEEQISNFIILENKKPKTFLDQLIKDSENKKPESKLSFDLTDGIWDRIRKRTDAGEPIFMVHTLNDKETDLTYSDYYTVILRFKNQPLAEKTAKICNTVAKNITIENTQSLQLLKYRFDEIEKARKDLQAALSPLVIESTIYRTRCDICPV